QHRAVAAAREAGARARRHAPADVWPELDGVAAARPGVVGNVVVVTLRRYPRRQLQMRQREGPRHEHARRFAGRAEAEREQLLGVGPEVARAEERDDDLPLAIRSRADETAARRARVAGLPDHA